MTTCDHCGKAIWFRRAHRLLSLHRRCYAPFYEARLAVAEQTGVISWDDVLMAPQHVSDALMAVNDRKYQRLSA